MISVPVFDTAALLQVAEFEMPAQDDPARHRLWNQLRGDCIAAAEHIELLEAALAEARSTE